MSPEANDEWSEEDVEHMKRVVRPFERKLVEDGEKIQAVDEVAHNDYVITFNQGASWDCYEEVINISAANFKVVTEYETLGGDQVRFTIEENDAIKA